MDTADRRTVHARLAPRRGAARATRWWGKAWVRAVEEAAYTETDLRAGRALARAGRVGGITVDVGGFVASVEDDGSLVTASGTVPVLDQAGRDALVETVAAESGRVAALLAGDLPHSLVEHADQMGVELLPYGAELATTCTCDFWADPCPHALAVLYQLTWLVEADPFVLLHLRGLPREQLLADLHARTVTASPEEGAATGHADDVDTALDAAVRAARILELLDDPTRAVDHLF
ncbi:SWIM zinc finger family protein [Nocardioides sp. cx-173]|uniref:SWIM zinc finger family protein n=1 Tax=Nocardioides sp. cx-173 TaxID=2898796 RepID=UPI001E3FB872|nr:SWIM zinc finger family protein [Nocardioides sp. cx-173]MCD4523631.1 SWIM zinc finger family protein [Nocardioides sp. cx-173]UGB42035.1 SWIM zinc finger family protein [Nocardioides sp. cx-173]